MTNKLLTFLKSKHKVEYDMGCVVPFYKTLWYRNYQRNTYICVIFPLAIILRPLRELYFLIILANQDVANFYKQQLKLRRRYDK